MLVNTWSSIALSALYNLLLVDGNASLGEPKRWISIDAIETWIKEHWGSLTHGRNMAQLSVNKAVPKCLYHAHNNGELMLSQDKTEVSRHCERGASGIASPACQSRRVVVTRAECSRARMRQDASSSRVCFRE